MALLYLETCLNILFTSLIQILLTSSSSPSHGCCHCYVTLDSWSLMRASWQVGIPISISVVLFLAGWQKSFKYGSNFVVPSHFVLVPLRLAVQLFFPPLSCANWLTLLLPYSLILDTSAFVLGLIFCVLNNCFNKDFSHPSTLSSDSHTLVLCHITFNASIFCYVQWQHFIQFWPSII